MTDQQILYRVNRCRQYILEGKLAVPCEHEYTWIARLEEVCESGRYCVAADTIEGTSVSTIFLGEDQQLGEGPPLIFETYVKGGPLDDRMERYSTWEEAEAGHQRMVERVRKHLRYSQTIAAMRAYNAAWLDEQD